MRIKIGVDFSREERFLASFKKGGGSFLNRLFTNQELRQNSTAQLASIFSLKEAVIKALELPQNSWLQINTNRKENGKVECSFLNEKIAEKISSLDTSISHDGGWIIAEAVVILKI